MFIAPGTFFSKRDKMITNEKIISETVFLNMCQHMEIRAIKVCSSKDFLEMEIQEQEFLELAKEFGAIVFCRFKYPSKTESLITSSTFFSSDSLIRSLLGTFELGEEFLYAFDDNECEADFGEDSDYQPDEMEEILLDEIIKANKGANFQEGASPKMAEMFFMLHGNCVGIKKENEKPLRTQAEENLIDILQRYREKAERIRNDEWQRMEEGKEKIRKMLLEDIRFQACTNKDLRMSYASEMWNAEGSELIRRYFPSRIAFINERTPSRDFLEFVDRVYNEYKLTKNMEKKQSKKQEKIYKIDFDDSLFD